MDSNLHLRRIFDNLGSIGVRSNVFGFNADFSLTAGSNKVDYTVGNLKCIFKSNSPTEFATGGYTFSQLVGNADFSRTFDKVIRFWNRNKKEQFEARAGQEESYVGGGVQSFPGLQPAMH
jgi:iron complex outermembrane receptor protein